MSLRWLFAIVLVVPFQAETLADEPMPAYVALWKSQGHEIVSLHAVVTTFHATHSNGLDLGETELLGALPRQGSGDAAAKLEALPRVLGFPASTLDAWGRPLEIDQDGEKLRNVFGVLNVSTSIIDKQSRVFDGEVDMHFNGYQADLHRGKSSLKDFTWRDLKFIPPDQVFGEDWKAVKREHGGTRVKSRFGEALVRDSDAFVYEYAINSPEHNRVHRTFQYDPFTVEGVALPRLRLDVKSLGGTVESLEVIHVRSAEVNVAIDGAVFGKEVPAKAVVVDFRDPGQEQVWKTEAAQRDALQFADVMKGAQASRRSRATQGAQGLPDWWTYATIGTLLGILLVVVASKHSRVQT